jgi:chromosome segregation ATPase
MAKPKQEVAELVRAAEALESELLKLESLSRAARKIQLNSERNITRAAQELTSVASLQEAMGAGLQALAQAVAQMQARQQAALEPLAAFANEIQARMQRLSEHMQTYATLGAAAGEVTSLIQSSDGDHGAVLKDVTTLLDKIAEGARALFDIARADDFPDLLREADSLRQRVTTLRKRLGAKAPS